MRITQTKIREVDWDFMDWIHLSQDKYHQRILLTMVITSVVVQKMGNFLQVRTTIKCRGLRFINTFSLFLNLFAEGKNFFLHSILWSHGPSFHNSFNPPLLTAFFEKLWRHIVLIFFRFGLQKLQTGIAWSNMASLHY